MVRLSSNSVPFWKAIDACSLTTDIEDPLESIMLQLHATEANIHELALAIEPATAPAEVVKRLDILQQCCKSLQAWFEVFERIPPGRYMGITFGIYVQLLTNIIILSRLTSPSLKEVSAPPSTWDPVEIRKQFDLVALLDRLANNIDAAAVTIGVQEDEPGEESSEFHPGDGKLPPPHPSSC